MRQRKAMRAMLAMLLVLVVYSSCAAETWPTLENYVGRCVLIVHCKTQVEGELVSYKVKEVWKGHYSPDLFYHKPMNGFVYTNRAHGNGDTSDGREVIFFFTPDNHPSWTKGKLLGHSTSFVVKEGKVIYASTSRSELRREYSLDDFKQTILEIVKTQKSKSKPKREQAP